jgi:hypothetical protein
MHYGEQPFHLATESLVKRVFKGDKRVKFIKPGETMYF